MFITLPVFYFNLQAQNLKTEITFELNDQALKTRFRCSGEDFRIPVIIHLKPGNSLRACHC